MSAPPTGRRMSHLPLLRAIGILRDLVGAAKNVPHPEKIVQLGLVEGSDEGSRFGSGYSYNMFEGGTI